MKIKTFKNLLRLHKIATTLIRYGFGGLVSELRIFPVFAAVEKVLLFKKAGKEKSVAERMRLVLEELGPTFAKLGQLASIRADVFPPDWVEELKKLQDAVPPFPFEEVKDEVERAFKKPISQVFATFDETPIASASIAQVHYATLKDGTEVAVKVKRPHIERVIESDILIMHTIAELLVKYVPASQRYRPKAVVDEFARVIHKELDLSIEGANAATFERNFRGDPTVQIPAVYWDYTTCDILTMERIDGLPIDEVEKLTAKGVDIKETAVSGVRAFFKQVFEHGIFHADLHPGNTFVRDDGVIIYLDFGIVGRIDRELRHYLASMLYYMVRQDYYSMAMVHRHMGLITKDVDVHEFEDALRDIMEPIFGKALHDINISTLIMKLIDTTRRFRIVLQPDLLLLEKTMIVMEGVGRQLYPEVNMWDVAKPLVYKWMIKEKLSPVKSLQRSKEFADNMLNTIFDLPDQVHSLVGHAANDELKIGFIHHRLEGLSEEVGRAGRAVSTGLIISGLVVASALITAFGSPGSLEFHGIPAIAMGGFAVAALLGVRLWCMGRSTDEKPKNIYDE